MSFRKFFKSQKAAEMKVRCQVENIRWDIDETMKNHRLDYEHACLSLGLPHFKDYIEVTVKGDSSMNDIKEAIISELKRTFNFPVISVEIENVQFFEKGNIWDFL